MEPNVLYYGDNLDVLRRHVRDESVDLVYLDPPFNSNVTYNVLFSEHDETPAAAQIEAFTDTWHWDTAAAAAYEEVVEGGGQVADAMIAFRTLLGTSDMLAYLSMMAPRLKALHSALKSTGSLYLHCDPTASHYLKLLLDAVFGPTKFLNEVIWCHYGGGQSKKWFPRKHDTLLVYRKGASWTFNADDVRVPYESGYASTVFGKKGDPNQKVYLPNPKGKIPEDFWIINRPYGREVLGYPTQKPEALLERIIKASSNEGDVVLDPFCGCGTTIAAAQKLNRRWFGIDITHLATGLIKHRLQDAHDLRAKIDYDVIGEPTDLSGAAELAGDDPWQFQAWALSLVGARTATSAKKGADRGIDGRLLFHDEGAGGKTKQIVFSVKAGKTGVNHVRDLRGVMEREKAEMGVLIALREPTGPMRAEAAGAGFYHSPWGTEHQRIQVVTVGELLGGKTLDAPVLHQTSRTFKKAPKAETDRPRTEPLFAGEETLGDVLDDEDEAEPDESDEAI